MSSPSNQGTQRTALLAVALTFAACEPPTAPAPSAPRCRIVPPSGPFDANLRPAPAPPAQQDLPVNQGGTSTLITPAPRHRWDPKQGLVETADGSLLLHGMVHADGDAQSSVEVAVLADYVPVEASIRLWSARRDEALDRVAGQSSITARIPGPSVAFDIELRPLTAPIGHWREVQTVVRLGDSDPDVRRWTLYAGPKPPAAVECVTGETEVTLTSGRSALSDGMLQMRSPQPTSVAIVASPLGGVPAQYVRFPRAGTGWAGAMHDARAAWVWEAPLSGPSSTWISSFWSAATHTDAAGAPHLR